MKGRQRGASDGVPVVAGSLLLGAARHLRRDLLGTFEQAMHEYGGRPVRFRVGPPKVGFLAEAIFDPEAARQILATDAATLWRSQPSAWCRRGSSRPTLVSMSTFGNRPRRNV